MAYIENAIPAKKCLTNFILIIESFPNIYSKDLIMSPIRNKISIVMLTMFQHVKYLFLNLRSFGLGPSSFHKKNAVPMSRRL